LYHPTTETTTAKIFVGSVLPNGGIPCSHESQPNSTASVSEQSKSKKEAPREQNLRSEANTSSVKQKVSLDERKSQLIPLQRDQTNNLPFVAGCYVWWDLKLTDKGQSFQHGKVNGVL
jgi:hypothetical protein